MPNHLSISNDVSPTRWATSFCLLEKNPLFLSLHRAHAPVAHITSHFILCCFDIGRLVAIHSSSRLGSDPEAMLCCASSPLQNLAAYSQFHIMWFLISVMSWEQRCHPVCTTHPLDDNTCCVIILLSSINQMNILTLMGALIFHSFFLYWWDDFGVVYEVVCRRTWETPRCCPFSYRSLSYHLSGHCAKWYYWNKVTNEEWSIRSSLSQMSCHGDTV